MKLVAISVGTPREVPFRGRGVYTSIFKSPVSHRVRVGRENIQGDAQADLTVHGGPEKAVYAYPSEHYEYWRPELPDQELPWGAFGENLTTAGLLEADVWIGDRYRIGTTELVVTQPRMPCSKLGVRFGRRDMVERFLRSRRSGFYLAVAQEGEIGAGDTIERLGRHDMRLTVADVVELYATEATQGPLLEIASEHPSLPAAWRERFRDRLSGGGA